MVVLGVYSCFLEDEVVVLGVYSCFLLLLVVVVRGVYFGCSTCLLEEVGLSCSTLRLELVDCCC